MDRKNKSTNATVRNESEQPDTGFNEQDSTNETTSNTIGTTTNDNRRDEETELKPPKRQRGRPKGSRNKSTETINLQEEEVTSTNPNGLPKVKVSKKSKMFLSEEQAIETSNFILSTINDLAINFVDEKAAFEPLELSLLSMSLPKYLATLETDKIDKASNLMYPLMGIVGAAVYGLRVTGIVLDKRKQAKSKQQQEKEFNSDNVREVNEVEEYTIPTEHSNDSVDWSKGKLDYSKGVRGF